MPLTVVPDQMQAFEPGGKPMTRMTHDPMTGRPNPWRIAGWSLAALLLLLPLAAMQFTAEVAWTAADFAFAAVLIGGSGLLIELGVRSTRNLAYRAALGLTVAAVFLLVWINAAVGIVGDEDNAFNLLYGLVVAIALIGAAAARLRAAGMARTCAAAAAAQAIVGVIATIAGAGMPPGAGGLALINGIFLALFAGAAWLFRHAARAAA